MILSLSWVRSAASASFSTAIILQHGHLIVVCYRRAAPRNLCAQEQNQYEQRSAASWTCKPSPLARQIAQIDLLETERTALRGLYV